VDPALEVVAGAGTASTLRHGLEEIKAPLPGLASRWPARKSSTSLDKRS
jgi:hypothetical protein